MKEHKETINIVTANVVSLAIFAGAAIVFTGIHVLCWGTDSIVNKIGSSAGLLRMAIILVALCVGIVVHELIHGIAWAHYTKSGFKSISFGVMWKMLTPYCHCSEPLKVKHYSVGALAPLVVLGIIPAIVGIAINEFAVTFIGIIFIAAAAGDIMVAWRLRKEKAENTILDHPTEAGYIVYEPEDDEE